MSQAIADGTQVNNTVVRLMKEDITDIDVNAFVYYAQHDLTVGAGFGTAISTRGGPTVQKELDGKGPLATCDVVVSGAGNMKADFIIHAVGPRFQEEGIETKLYETMINTLKAAEEKGIANIAFPAMGAGYYGIPADVSAKVMTRALKEYLSGETRIKEVVICVLDTPQFNSFKAPVEALGK
jgi:O-acetyl-ADP-ribose deacetylase (regulator of RNase III)